MNTNTSYFRVALTIAAIWVAACAYIYYSGYDEAYRSTENAAYAVSDEGCTTKVLDTTKPGIEFREQTSAERSDCYRRATQLRVSLIESDRQFALEQAWKSFGWKGALPALLLLMLVAFWTLIATGIRRAISGYVNWLRFGSTKPNGDSRDDEA